jgi:hypothetical protein
MTIGFTIKIKCIDDNENTVTIYTKEYKNDVKAKMWGDLTIKVLKSLLPDIRVFYHIDPVRE